MSTTQLTNYSTLAGVIVMVLGYFHIAVGENVVAFLLAAVWSVGSVAYNFYNRYSKGDLSLGGVRKA